MEVKTGFDLLQGGDRQKCRVFLPGRPNRLDFSDLERYGHNILRIWDRATIFPDENIDGTRVVEELHRNLLCAGFSSHHDYVALAGDALINAIVCMSLGRFYHDVTFLRYDTKLGGYWPCKVQ